MVLYKKTSVTAKKGINFVRSAVEDAGSIFHKIEGENDHGIDALIELIRDEVPLNRQIAVNNDGEQTTIFAVLPAPTFQLNIWSNPPLQRDASPASRLRAPELAR